LLDRRLCIAPMLDWTDRRFRFFVRLISRHTLLYTEMVTTGALLHGDAPRFLDYHPAEHPLALQLGGSEPDDLARCAEMGEQWGYDEINLNVGCPSDRVQSGRFGACLMAEPQLVADCVQAMREKVSIPVTVKHRIGIDDRDSYQELCGFVGTVSAAGCDTFIVHARKAWLKGLSPKQNREIPPLCYETVHRLKQDFPELVFVINGGITSLEQAQQQLKHVDGVMMGREAYHNPWILAQADKLIFCDDHPVSSRQQVLQQMLPYMEESLASGIRLGNISRHILGLFQGQPGAAAWRRYISEHAHLPGSGIEVVQNAAEIVWEIQRIHGSGS
jgi:tRNA-dihydrouridine synthase A